MKRGVCLLLLRTLNISGLGKKRFVPDLVRVNESTLQFFLFLKSHSDDYMMMMMMKIWVNLQLKLKSG